MNRRKLPKGISESDRDLILDLKDAYAFQRILGNRATAKIILKSIRRMIQLAPKT